jgi:hypothetical protein
VATALVDPRCRHGDPIRLNSFPLGGRPTERIPASTAAAHNVSTTPIG